MTYFGFLFKFLVVPILIFIAISYWDNRKQVAGFRDGRAVWIEIGIHILLAVIYTTPWDNYLVATGVWYYDPRLVLNRTIGYVPVEEYAFFILQAFLTGLFGMWLWNRFYHKDSR